MAPITCKLLDAWQPSPARVCRLESPSVVKVPFDTAVSANATLTRCLFHLDSAEGRIWHDRGAALAARLRESSAEAEASVRGELAASVARETLIDDNICGGGELHQTLASWPRGVLCSSQSEQLACGAVTSRLCQEVGNAARGCSSRISTSLQSVEAGGPAAPWRWFRCLEESACASRGTCSEGHTGNLCASCKS